MMAPKDKNIITQKSGVIYVYKCDKTKWDKEYIEESARTLGERFNEHLKFLPLFMNISKPQAIMLVLTVPP